MSGGSIRDALASFAPRWLNSPAVGARLIFMFGLAMDALAEKMNQAMRMHIPTYGDVTGLPACGADRVIPQGPNEPPAGYAKRLQSAYDDWQLAGIPRALLRQIRGYAAPATPTVRTVGQGLAGTGAVWDTYLSTDTTLLPPSHARASYQNWNWDGTLTSWWRCWVIIDCSGGAPFTQPVLGTTGRKLGQGNVLGFSGKTNDVAALQAIVGLWKPANVQVVNVILTFSSTLFDATNFAGANPTGQYAQPYAIVAGTAIPTRARAAAYLPGVT